MARRTIAQERAANYWQGSAASFVWDSFAIDLISRNGLDLPHAARVLALTAVAMADAEVACWDAKYAYWTARPDHHRSRAGRALPDPAVPSLPLGPRHGLQCRRGGLAHLFPNEELDLLALAPEAAASRGWAGIHFPIDNDAGQVLGRYVGYLVIEAAREGDAA